MEGQNPNKLLVFRNRTESTDILPNVVPRFSFSILPPRIRSILSVRRYPHRKCKVSLHFHLHFLRILLQSFVSLHLLDPFHCTILSDIPISPYSLTKVLHLHQPQLLLLTTYSSLYQVQTFPTIPISVVSNLQQHELDPVSCRSHVIRVNCCKFAGKERSLDNRGERCRRQLYDQWNHS